jgi:hypothetical protein
VTARKPEYTRPFSAEYLHACGSVVERVMMVHPRALREFVDVNYVAWLESELARARENAGGK